MKRIAAVSLIALTPVLAHADSVFLKRGGEIKGEIIDRRADAVVIEVGPGRVTLPMSSVDHIVSSATDVGAFRAREAALAEGDVAGWLALAAWAQDRDLATFARQAYEHVLAVDPLNPTAHAGLGEVRVGSRWMTPQDANRSRGLIEFEGTWMTPEERGARLEERAAMAAERQAMAEAEARTREAEARAAEAEARVRAAEADARQAADAGSTSGIPYGYVFGGYGVPYGGYGPYGNYNPVSSHTHTHTGSHTGGRPHPEHHRDQDQVHVVPPPPLKH